ncbi:MAG: hypothetical protein BWY15_00817 [Firmicutes bacterium ADurb.Bin193]|nr:MAG: hypothetical protein BWY15_00817 [Firmicutes bacterium ADurb.Bin193]
MRSLFFDLFSLCKVLLAFSFLYIVIPSALIRFDKDTDSWTDKIFIPLIHSNLIIIALVHFLTLFKAYETISLTLALIFVVFLVLRLRASSAHMEPIEKEFVIARVLDASEKGSKYYLNKLLGIILSAFRSLTKKFKYFLLYIIAVPFDGVLLLIPAGFGVYDRFVHSIKYCYYGYFDPYVHLAWVKFLGANEIYKDGIYPYGYEAIISAMNKLFYVDPSSIIRFIGPIASCMIVFSIYFILKKYVKNSFITFVCVAVYIISTELPNNIIRQRAALPQEYASMFLLPGVYYLDLYFRTDKRKYLLIAAEILALSILIHLYAAVFIAIAYAFVSLIHIRRLLNGKTFTAVALHMFGAGFVGFLPILVALMCGMKFHTASIEFIKKNVTPAQTAWWWGQMFQYNEENSALLLLIICIVATLVLCVFLYALSDKRSVRDDMKIYAAVAIFGGFLYTQYRAPQLGVLYLIEYLRAGSFCALVSVVVYGFFMSTVDRIPINKIVRRAIVSVIGIYIILLLFNVENFKIERGYQAEYDQAAMSYYKIKEEFPALNWTIVSPVEQYSYSMGYGWHYNLWEFVAKAIEYPSDEFVFTTDYVFILVEKIPLNARKPVTIEDAQKPFPAITGGLDEYYTNLQKRRVIEAKAYFWLENYMAEKGDFTVYYEDEQFKIYMLKQDGMNPINLVAR